MSVIRSLFLVGTDTGVGKTTISQGLLRLASRRGLKICPFKPAESGATEDMAGSDAERLLQATSRTDLTPADIAPYRLELPLAPGLAARLESRVLAEHRLVLHGRRMLDASAALLVESAGGLLSPYAAQQTPASLARAMIKHIAMDILLVSANRLGAINQCALASLALQSFALPCAGIVLVDLLAGTTPAQTFNRGEIAAATNLPVLGTLPHIPHLHGVPPSGDHIADALQAQVDLRPLFSGALTRRFAQSP